MLRSRREYIALSLLVSGMLYVLNWPIMYLIDTSPCYRERFYRMYGLRVVRPPEQNGV